MTRRIDAELIERALERAAEEPDRVSALKRLVRQRLTAPQMQTGRPVAAADLADDSLWDNVPI